MAHPAEQISNAILKTLDNFPEIMTAILFGSAASGRLRADSDVDIAIAGTAPLGIARTAELCRKLERALGRTVDLVDLHRVSGIILVEVFEKGVVVLKRSNDEYARLLRKLWYFREDELPNIRYILNRQVERFVNEE
jgi:predicted nucleotidyltransferase